MSIKSGETVLIDEEQDDGWCTITKRDESVGFVPVAYLDKSKSKKKGTLFAKKKGSSEPAPPVPPFGASGGKDKSSDRGTRRFATRRETSSLTVTDLDSRYGGASPKSQRAVSGAVQTAMTASAPAIVAPVAAAATPSDSSKAPNITLDVKAATPSPAATGPKSEGLVSPHRKKVGKLASQFEGAKDGAAPEQGPSSPGPRKIMVKKKVVRRTGQEGDSLSVSAELPPVPPAERDSAGGEKLSSPRRGTTGSLAPAEPRLTAEELTKMAERRTNIFREIYETERSYCRALREVIDRYVNPMKESKCVCVRACVCVGVYLCVFVHDNVALTSRLAGCAGVCEF